jgi:inorganic pyrophosphatase
VEQNDRYIGVPVISPLYKGLTEISTINKNLLEEIQHFFVSYNAIAGKTFSPQGWAGAQEARERLERAFE